MRHAQDQNARTATCRLNALCYRSPVQRPRRPTVKERQTRPKVLGELQRTFSLTGLGHNLGALRLCQCDSEPGAHGGIAVCDQHQGALTSDLGAVRGGAAYFWGTLTRSSV